jgi:hypothetical protein
MPLLLCCQDCNKRHDGTDDLRISNYDYGPDIEIIVGNKEIYLLANKEVRLIVVEIVHIKLIFFYKI